MIGTTLSHYEITAELGRGGMGVVYRATDARLGRDVALKFLAPHLTNDPTARERFMREARTAAQLRHDNICAIHDVVETDDGRVFIVMPHYEGRTLQDLLKEGPLPRDQAVSIAASVAAGLRAAHKKGLTHRDIKPGNILITKEDGVKILDFGLAKGAGEVDLTQSGSTVGTMAYMSPEQVQNGAVDGRSDLWSLGVVLHEMLTGKRPFVGNYDAAVIYSIVNQEPELDLDGLPPALVDVVRTLLAKEPDDRFDDAGAVIRALRDPGEHAAATPARSESGYSGVLVKSALGVLAALILVVLSWMALSREGEPPVSTTQTVRAELPTLAVMYIDNDTDRPRFGRTIQDMLARNLSQVDSLRVMSTQRLFDVLRQELGSDQETINAATATSIARQAGITAMILGSVVQLGEQFAINVELTDVSTGAILDAVSVTAADETGVMDAINEVTRELIQGADGIGSAEAGLIRIQNVATDDLTAYELYEQGSDHFNHWRFAQAKAYFDEAIERDSTFVAAYLGSIRTSSVFSFSPTADNSHIRRLLERAARHLDHATREERDIIEYSLNNLDFKSRDPATDLRLLADRYPSNKMLQFEAAVFTSGPEQLEYYDRAIDLDPAFGVVYNQLGYDQLYANNIEDALSSIQRYRSLQPDVLNATDSSWEIMTAAGREEEAVGVLSDVLGVHAQETSAEASIGPDDIFWRRMYTHAIAGDTLAAANDFDGYLAAIEDPAILAPYRASHLALLFGQWERARLLSSRYLREARRNSDDDNLIRHLRNHAAVAHAVGRHDEAVRLMDEAVEISSQVYSATFNPIPFLAAFDHTLAYMDAGMNAEAERWTERLGQELGRGGLDGRHRILSDAIRVIQSAQAGNWAETESFFSQTHPFFVAHIHKLTESRAHFAMSRGDAADAEFHMMLLEHNISSRAFSISPYSNFFIFSPTALYRKGLMYERFGDEARAADAYREALARWERTGATFRYIDLARERLQALKQ